MDRKTPSVWARAISFYLGHNPVFDVQETRAAGLEGKDVVTPWDSPEMGRKQGDECWRVQIRLSVCWSPRRIKRDMNYECFWLNVQISPDEAALGHFHKLVKGKIKKRNFCGNPQVNTWSCSISICFFRNSFPQTQAWEQSSTCTGPICQGSENSALHTQAKENTDWENDHLKEAAFHHLHFISGGDMHLQNPRNPDFILLSSIAEPRDSWSGIVEAQLGFKPRYTWKLSTPYMQ